MSDHYSDFYDKIHNRNNEKNNFNENEIVKEIHETNTFQLSLFDDRRNLLGSQAFDLYLKWKSFDNMSPHEKKLLTSVLK